MKTGLVLTITHRALLLILLRSGVGKGPGNHPIARLFIPTYCLSTFTMNLITNQFSLIPLYDSFLMTTNDMTVTTLFIFPDFRSTGGTKYCEYTILERRVPGLR